MTDDLYSQDYEHIKKAGKFVDEIRENGLRPDLDPQATRLITIALILITILIVAIFTAATYWTDKQAANKLHQISSSFPYNIYSIDEAIKIGGAITETNKTAFVSQPTGQVVIIMTTVNKKKYKLYAMYSFPSKEEGSQRFYSDIGNIFSTLKEYWKASGITIKNADSGIIDEVGYKSLIFYPSNK